MASLLDALTDALKTVRGSHEYTVQVVRSQTRRAHALFPYSSSAKVWQEEVLVLLSERLEEEGQSVMVPIAAIEAALYTIPSTSTSLVYISKVDTTGLALPSSPTRELAAAFIRYHLEHPTRDCKRVRIHIFGRAQGQYLFPGSVDNKGKRVLSDKGLLRWWKATADKAAPADTSLHYLVPGLAEIEAASYIPSPSTSATTATRWKYGHPYATLPSPLFPDSEAASARWFDHIPSFPDDPKARFLHSLTSSVVEPAGQEGDYDDIMLQLLSSSFSTGASTTAKLAQVEKDKEKERQRLVEGVKGGVDEFWERMAFRQECASGTLVGFFVLARDLPTVPTPKASPSKSNGSAAAAAAAVNNHASTASGVNGHVRPYVGALSHSTFTSLWSSFHNVDYAATTPGSLVRIAERSAKWTEDTKRAVLKGGYVASEPEALERERAYRESVLRAVTVTNGSKDDAADEEAERKRKREEQQHQQPKTVVNMMVPRKKAKKA